MQGWHDWYAAVNEKWGLERGDDIHETGAHHKSLEDHNRELHRENKSLDETIEMKRRAVSGLTTMIKNLTSQQKEMEKELEKLEAQLQKSDSNKVEIANDIVALQEKLARIKERLSEKVAKLDKVNGDIEKLHDDYISKMESVNDAIESDKLITHYLNQHVSIMLKASILDMVLQDAAKIRLEIPDAAALVKDTFIDDRNFLRWEDVFKTGLRVFIAGFDGATNVSPSTGGGGTTNDMPWREKDEDFLLWARRAMLYAHKKHYLGNRYQRSQSV